MAEHTSIQCMLRYDMDMLKTTYRYLTNLTLTTREANRTLDGTSKIRTFYA